MPRALFPVGLALEGVPLGSHQMMGEQLKPVAHHDDAQQDPVPTVPAVPAASPPEAKAETAVGIPRPNSLGSKDPTSGKQLIQGYPGFKVQCQIY